MIKVILWDVDGTLLDFKKSEEEGIRACMREIGVTTCTDEMLDRYSVINRYHWEALERGEMTKPEVLIGRFEKFFAQEGIQCDDIEAFNKSYQGKLGSVFFENENSLSLCRQLHQSYHQYVVTNGTIEAQRNKLQYSGLGETMDEVFISDEVGVEKPGIGFFEHAFKVIQEQLGDLPAKEEILIIGDSLTSDMRGGNNAGIKCCWYNPFEQINNKGVRLDYEIHKLWDVLDVLKKEQGEA